ncbi:hypothetical protein K443DRAFT_537873 [Laccaria amethystina LaAM-08-1]|uniref:Uncharacterized protein n=1 Tax=Laccaria amethystina LaAM-08-1 TaxID=1095629 RepID=A0A0C9WRS3_9AGAR|nr:hypothetical protein K443DRAFT_537873 [Laccaria amethystina LaAM-08-1]
MMGKRSASSLSATNSRSTKCKPPSFIYKHGRSGTASGWLAAIVAELAANITPFHDAERLFYVVDNSDQRLHEDALESVPKVLQDGTKIAEEIVAGYIRKTKEVLPSKLTGDPKKDSQRAKQSLKDQLVLLEVLFWAMFNYVQCTGPLVVTICEAAYGTYLGSTQANNTVLLDEESSQIQHDCASIWILITTELESLGDPQFPKIPITIHLLPPTGCTYLAWKHVLPRLH